MTNTKTNAIAKNKYLNADEKDAIGEILNISMGAAATAVSIMLNRKVNITTPNVRVVRGSDFSYNEIEPAVGIEIEYVQGLHGSNIMIMNIKDVKKIVSLLSPGDDGETEDDAELDEIHISALGEIMNQMMGSSSTALASFLNRSINISTPKPFELVNLKGKLSGSDDEYIVSVGFRLQVENLLDSEFITVMPIEFTKELVKNASAIEETASGQSEAPVQEQMREVTGHTQVPGVAYMEDFADNKAHAPKKKAVAPKIKEQKEQKNISVTPLQFGTLNGVEENEDTPDQVNLGLVMGVELNVTVEIGRTKKQVKDILALRQGSIVELDKQAGEPVDVVVNGQLIARGDVVVIDDNFGVRITEIVSRPM